MNAELDTMQKSRLIRRRLLFTAGACIPFGLLKYFQWSIEDAITIIGVAILWVPTAILFIASIVVSITCIDLFSEVKFIALAPAALTVLAFLFPYTALWVTIDFPQHRFERQTIVAAVADGRLKPNVDHNDHLIALGSSYPTVSNGGNDIVVEEHDGKKYILFFTQRGILGNFSGFLYVQGNGDPNLYGGIYQDDKAEIRSFGDSWYWVSSDR